MTDLSACHTSSSSLLKSPAVDGSFLLSQEGRKYIQLWEVVCGPGTDLIKENVLHNLDNQTLRESLDARRHIFKRLLKQNRIYDKQFQTLFPRRRADPDHSAIDISLWVIICKTVTRNRTKLDYSRKPTDCDVAWEHDAVRLRDVRNHLSHLIQPKFTAEEYRHQSSIVKDALGRLGVSDEELAQHFVDDDSFVLSDESKNYLRLRVLVVEVGTERIRYHILRNLNYTSLHEAVSAESNRPKLTDISPTQCQVLFPKAGNQKTLETDVDISLWTVVCRKLIDPSVVGSFDWSPSPASDQTQWFHDVCRVRDVRNYLVHLPRPRISGDEFARRWGQLSACLVRLGAESDLIASYIYRDFFGMQTEEVRVAGGSFRLMPRSQWGAASPAYPLDEFGTEQAHYVIISQCIYAKPCHNTHECCMHVRNMQRYHTQERGFADIAYNYLVGNDGVVYEGRGCKYRSATGRGWPFVRFSYSISFMGAYIPGDEHSLRALDTTHLLLSYLSREGRLQWNYILYGIRQIRSEHDAPKLDLYEKITKWPHWRPCEAENENE